MKGAISRRRSEKTTNFLRTQNPSSTSLSPPSIPRILSRDLMVTMRRVNSRRGPSASRRVVSMTRKKIPEKSTRRRIFQMIKKSKIMKKTVLMKMATGTIIKRPKSLSNSKNLLQRSARSSHLPLDKSRKRRKKMRRMKISALAMNLLTISICLDRTCLPKMMSV